jgi:peptidoglycan/xylan/chitin deacetylase (PgdA/CDA1 family)
MAEFVIPEGYGLPLVDLDTDLLPAPTMDAVTAAAVPVVVASPELQARAASQAITSGRGALVLMFDDGKADALSIAAPAVEAVGGRATFAIATGYLGTGGSLTTAGVTALAARGHEIANHSASHTNMTTQTATQRLTEWDTAHATIEALTGVPCTTFVYPNNAANVTTDKEAYLRYGRTFAGNTDPWMSFQSERGKRIRYGRFSWVNGTHNQMLDLMRRAAKLGQVLTAFTHNVDGSDLTNGVTTAQLNAVIALAVQLGLPIVTASQAFPGRYEVPNGGFESTTLADDWYVPGLTAGLTAAAITKATLTGLSGSKCLELANTTGAGYITATNTFAIPVEQGVSRTLSFQFSQAWTSGGGGFGYIREYGFDGTTQIGSDITTIGITSSAVGSWVTKSGVYTPVSPLACFARIVLGTNGFIGQAWFDHVDFAETKQGVLN